jgi:hypothetical protein
VRACGCEHKTRAAVLLPNSWELKPPHMWAPANPQTCQSCSDDAPVHACVCMPCMGTIPGVEGVRVLSRHSCSCRCLLAAAAGAADAETAAAAAAVSSSHTVSHTAHSCCNKPPGQSCLRRCRRRSAVLAAQTEAELKRQQQDGGKTETERDREGEKKSETRTGESLE